MDKSAVNPTFQNVGQTTNAFAAVGDCGNRPLSAFERANLNFNKNTTSGY